MKLYSVFKEMSSLPNSPFNVLRADYDRQGRLSNINPGMEEFVRGRGISLPVSLTALFPDSFSEAYIRKIFDHFSKEDLLSEHVSLKTLTYGEKKTSYLCLEKLNRSKDGIVLVALPFDKETIVRLLQLYARFEGYYNSNPDLVISVDQTWSIADINTAGYVKLGYPSRDEVKIQGFDKVFVLSEDAKKYISGELAKGNSITEFELLLKKREGGYITGYASIFSLAHQHDEPYLYYFHIKDMTLQTEAFTGQLQMNMELSELNEELNRAYSSMLSQEKMAALGLLAAGMAHEINNPLGFIFNNITVLMNHFKDLKSYIESVRELYTAEAGSSLAEIESLDKRLDLDYIFEDIISIEQENQEGIDRIKKLIGSLNSFARKDQTERMSFYDLNKAVSDTLTISRNEYKYSIEIEEHYGKVQQFLCIAPEINQVILNLVMNAIEAVQREGRAGKRGRIVIETSQDDSWSYLKVSDNGPGVSAENAGRIFDPFFTTKPIGSGSGLGLTLAHDIIVNKHHGRLVYERKETGAVFLVSIPRNLELAEE